MVTVLILEQSVRIIFLICFIHKKYIILLVLSF